MQKKLLGAADRSYVAATALLAKVVKVTYDEVTEDAGNKHGYSYGVIRCIGEGVTAGKVRRR